MSRILFVEDDKDSIQAVLRRIEGKHEYEITSFGGASGQLSGYKPDIVVLDLIEDPLAGPPPSGQAVYDNIWSSRFCPIVIYSASPDMLSEQTTNPFVKRVQKGSGSDESLEKIIQELSSHVKAIKETEETIQKILHNVMKEIAPSVFDSIDSESDRNDMLVRCGKRRVAAYVDESLFGPALQSWEMYLVPPINKDVQLGDILRLTTGEPNDPKSFRLVLTPSCDMVSINGRSPKVKNILVATCAPTDILNQKTHLLKIKKLYSEIKKLDGKVSKSEGKGENKKDKDVDEEFKETFISSALTPGFIQHFLPLPSFPQKIPEMVADFKNLELIPIEKIAGTSPEFSRVASCDSPFRELISWAYIQTAGRPGIPDRDFKTWYINIFGEKKD